MTEKTISVDLTADILDHIHALKDKCKILSCVMKGDKLHITIEIDEKDAFWFSPPYSNQS